MNYDDLDTLSAAVDRLTKEGYKESFTAERNCILSAYSKKEYRPGDLRIVRSFRFDGMTDPADEALVLAIEANDGTKGTLVMSYSAEQDQDGELIKRIPSAA